MDDFEREEAGTGIRVSDVLAIAWRRKWWLIVPTIVVSVAAVAVALVLPPVYRSHGTILIERPNVPDDLVESTVTSYASERIEQLRREFITTDNLAALIEDYDLYPGNRAGEPIEVTAQRVRENLSVEYIQLSRNAPALAFQVAFEYGDAEKTQLVTAEVASWYLDENASTRQEKSRETAEFLDQQTQALGTELRRLEEQLARFKKEHAGRLPDQLDVNRAELSDLLREQRDVAFEQQSLRDRRADLARSLAALERGDDSAVVQQDPNLLALQNERAKLAATFTERHPDIKRLDREIAAIRALRAGGSENAVGGADPQGVEMRAQIEAIDRNLNALGRRTAALGDDIAGLREDIRHAAAIEDEYRQLTRDYENTLTDYRTVRRKKLTADMGASLELNQKGERFTLIEAPRMPGQPIKPNRKLIALGGFGAALAMACGLALLIELSDKTIRGTRKLAALTGMEPLLTVPHITTRRELFRRWIMRGVTATGTLAAVGVALVFVHTNVVPLDILAADLEARIESRLDGLSGALPRAEGD